MMRTLRWFALIAVLASCFVGCSGGAMDQDAARKQGEDYRRLAKEQEGVEAAELDAARQQFAEQKKEK